ncbi:MAG: RHS repeat protein, partial [Nitrospirae bacterium]|nr:RHS repeat protein [Nitrospirota bacterium]
MRLRQKTKIGGIGNEIATHYYSLNKKNHLKIPPNLPLPKGGNKSPLSRGDKGCVPLLSLFNCAFVIFASIPPLSADTASYIYDDLGRLIKVVSGTGEVAIYNYDEVGNLISISSEQTEASPPVLNSISPDVIFVGRTLVVTIAGENLS